jgi:hypothetical protein
MSSTNGKDNIDPKHTMSHGVAQTKVSQEELELHMEQKHLEAQKR